MCLHLGRIGLYIWELEKSKINFRVLWRKTKYFQEAEDFLRIWKDQCIILREQDSTDAPLRVGGLISVSNPVHV